ncbi:outer-membrane lipoprotein carrier protein [Desulfuromonas sp. AOP6]|nr:outer-membrane lipoprotein carrier protein [Desulfuromonas sp. AOP6]
MPWHSLKVFLTVFCSLLLLVPGETPAQGPDLTRVIDAVEAPFRPDKNGRQAIASFEAAFAQESMIASLEQSQEGSGIMQVKFVPPGKEKPAQVRFRWIYTIPSSQEIVSDGETVWVYLPENQQVLQSSLAEVGADQAQENPLVFITGLGNLSENFKLSWASPRQDADGNYLLALEPKKPSAMVLSLRLAVAKEAVLNQGKEPVFPLRKVEIIDTNDNRTQLSFGDVRINPPLADSRFDFQVPAGVEVVTPDQFGPAF